MWFAITLTLAQPPMMGAALFGPFDTQIECQQQVTSHLPQRDDVVRDCITLAEVPDYIAGFYAGATGR